MDLGSHEAKAFLAWAQTHPVEWMHEVFDDDVWEMQRRIIESVRDNKRTAARSCHGIGKSWVAARVALWFLLSHPNAVVATTAPTFRQVEKILWQEIGKAVGKARVPLGGKPLQTEFKIAPGWYAFGFSSDDPTAAQGLHAEHMLLIYDEAAGLSAEIWEALEGALTSEHTRLLSIGNPTDPTSPFAKEFKTPGTTKFAIGAFDTPNFTRFGIKLADVVNGTWEQKIGKAKTPMPWLITPEWVADKVKRWGVESPAFKSRVLAEFPDLGDDTLIPLSWLEAAQARDYAPTDKDAKELVVDVARFGGDETVFGLRHGNRFRVKEAHRGISTVQTSGHIVRLLGDLGIKRVRVDGAGVGGGVVDQVKALQKDVLEMNAGSGAADDTRFVNARAEWFWTLREGFEEGVYDIDQADDDIFGQLSNLKFSFDNKARILIESKKDMRKRGLPSPDRADAMAMAFAPSRGFNFSGIKVASTGARESPNKIE